MQLTQKEIEFGFWNIHSRSPLWLKLDDPKIKNCKCLGISFHKEHNKSKEIKKWNQLLPHLDKVEYLWTYHRLNQQTFDVITSMKNLKGLNVKWSSIDDLRSITNLPHLENLNLGSSPKIERIREVTELRTLQTFESENLKKVKDWNSLENCKQLQGLGISGGTYQILTVDDLYFIKELTSLKYLFLTAINARNKSLLPLENLKKLQCLRLADRFGTERITELQNKLPNLKYGNVCGDELSKMLKYIFEKKQT